MRRYLLILLIASKHEMASDAEDTPGDAADDGRRKKEADGKADSLEERSCHAKNSDDQANEQRGWTSVSQATDAEQDLKGQRWCWHRICCTRLRTSCEKGWAEHRESKDLNLSFETVSWRWRAIPVGSWQRSREVVDSDVANVLGAGQYQRRKNAARSGRTSAVIEA